LKKSDDKKNAPTPSIEAAAADSSVTRGRPGRRTLAERREAVLALLSGKSSVDQLAQQYGVLPETVLGWRDAALEGISAALLQGDGSTERERALEKKVRELEAAFSQVSIERALAMKAVEEWKTQTRPSRPTRSRR
jgi:transposase-like protein